MSLYHLNKTDGCLLIGDVKFGLCRLLAAPTSRDFIQLVTHHLDRRILRISCPVTGNNCYFSAKSTAPRDLSANELLLLLAKQFLEESKSNIPNTQLKTLKLS